MGKKGYCKGIKILREIELKVPQTSNVIFAAILEDGSVLMRRCRSRYHRGMNCKSERYNVGIFNGSHFSFLTKYMGLRPARKIVMFDGNKIFWKNENCENGRTVELYPQSDFRIFLWHAAQLTAHCVICKILNDELND